MARPTQALTRARLGGWSLSTCQTYCPCGRAQCRRQAGRQASHVAAVAGVPPDVRDSPSSPSSCPSMSLGCPDRPGRLTGFVVVHDDVGVFGGADRVEVELLGRYVASASVVLPAAGTPSMATRVGCAVATDPTSSARRLSSSLR